MCGAHTPVPRSDMRSFCTAIIQCMTFDSDAYAAALATARESANTDAERVYNSVPELIALRRSGYLLGGTAEGTPRDWTADESATIKQAYTHGEYTREIAALFAAETLEAKRETS